MINKKIKSNKGFTLVELLVVIAIIGVLAVVAVPTLFKQIDKARVADVNSNVSSIKSATMAYYADNASRPTLGTGSVDDTDLVKKGYLDSTPNKNNMTYTVKQDKSENTILEVTGIKDGMVASLRETYGNDSILDASNTVLTVTVMSKDVQ